MSAPGLRLWVMDRCEVSVRPASSAAYTVLWMLLGVRPDRIVSEVVGELTWRVPGWRCSVSLSRPMRVIHG